MNALEIENANAAFVAMMDRNRDILKSFLHQIYLDQIINLFDYILRDSRYVLNFLKNLNNYYIIIY